MEKVGIRQATKSGYIIVDTGGVADLSYPTSLSRRGRVQKNGKASPTITTTGEICKILGKEQVRELVEKNENEPAKVEDYLVNGFGVFKLSPRECGRLMGVKDSDIDKMLEVNSRTQCYKQFGNSIAVPVLMALFSQLGLKGVPKWNELSQEQRQELVDRNMDFLSKKEEKRES